jgi:hypothetical protein
MYANACVSMCRFICSFVDHVVLIIVYFLDKSTVQTSSTYAIGNVIFTVLDYKTERERNLKKGKQDEII